MSEDIKDTVTPELRRISAGMYLAMRNGAMESARVVTGNVRRSVLSMLNKNTKGGLARSFRERFIADTKQAVTVGSLSDLIYARAQDRTSPTVILPKTAKMLTVPLVKMAIGKRAAAFPGLFRIRSKKGNLLLVQRNGKKLKPIFALKDKVTIRGVGYLEAARKISEPEIDRIIGKRLGALVVK